MRITYYYHILVAVFYTWPIFALRYLQRLPVPDRLTPESRTPAAECPLIRGPPARLTEVSCFVHLPFRRRTGSESLELERI